MMKNKYFFTFSVALFFNIILVTFSSIFSLINAELKYYFSTVFFYFLMLFIIYFLKIIKNNNWDKKFKILKEMKLFRILFVFISYSCLFVLVKNF